MRFSGFTSEDNRIGNIRKCNSAPISPGEYAVSNISDSSILAVNYLFYWFLVKIFEPVNPN